MSRSFYTSSRSANGPISDRLNVLSYLLRRDSRISGWDIWGLCCCWMRTRKF